MSLKKIGVFGIFLYLSVFVLASQGVSPGSYLIDEVSEYHADYVFDFFLGNGISEEIFTEGDLAKYVSLDKEKIEGHESVTVSLNLPLDVEAYGINYVKIFAGEVFGILKIEIPYPDRYFDLDFDAGNVNLGQKTFFFLKVSNMGNSPEKVSPFLEIYKNNNSLESYNSKSVNIGPGNFSLFNFSFDASNYERGNYLAVASVNLENEIFRVENPFRVGDFLVGIVDYTHELNKSEVDRFEIDVSNLGGYSISDLYAEVVLSDYPEANFVTSSLRLAPWKNSTLVGFIDTSLIEKDDFSAKIILHYDDSQITKLIDLHIVRKFNWVFSVLIVLFVFILLLFIFKKFRRKKKN